ncbi:23S rRNA (uracil-C(5))-methyltransferase RlmCD [Planctomycetes bacterium Pla163]|uniref:23S rRNA (Uracil-C(5))-methyltransferase RlmCD n=1 Tax=Rohdeia mirabilis TaxID=2528008 RepID=A0A518CX91_9BACT|nr:23S rRNA (uracil-C(5))-methyltransferase RlmCD [Planctomycetes bacterium Pla163]
MTEASVNDDSEKDATASDEASDEAGADAGATGSAAVATDRDPGPMWAGDPTAARMPRRDDVIEFDVRGFDGRGNAIGSVGAYSVTLRRGPLGTLPGARVRARVAKRRRSAVEAHVLEFVERSPHEVEARCEHAADCGGCRFQELDYARQLVELGAIARRRLRPLEPFGLELPDPIGADDPWRYRNKMDFTFASRRWLESDDDGRHPNFALGLHAPGRFEKGLDVRACHLQGAVGDRIVTAARSRALELELEPWDLRDHTGFLRHLVVRRGEATGEWLVYLVTSCALDRDGELAPRFERYWRALVEDMPEITTLVHGATDRQSSVAIGDTDRVLHGSGRIRERLAGLEHEISPRSFFQTNTAQAERLFETVAEFATAGRATPSGVFWDLYCGAGLFALALADRFERAFGAELVPEAIADARANAVRNGVTNAHFEVADAAELLVRAAAGALDWPAPDVAVVDPPRAGLHKDAVDALVRVGPPRLVYVSCHLDSAARDLVPLLTQEGADGRGAYRLVRSALVDLFPHTPHLEGVFLLER